jgi:outer membrane protein W
MMKSFLMTALILGSTALHALEIDEKLTLRFLKVSNSKKTVLINRGAEDGLAVGEHAKFFITSGVIARGVVEKVSPSRSIWSLYRVVDSAEIVDGKVLNLKIASPVKITDDPSKSLKDEPIPGGSEKMDMNDPAESGKADDFTLIDEADKKEMEGLGIDDETVPEKKAEKPSKNSSKNKKRSDNIPVVNETVSYDKFSDRNWEVFGTVYLTSLSGTTSDPIVTDASGNTVTTDSSSTNIDFSLGIERYLTNLDSETWRNFSGQAFVRSQTVKSGSGTTVTSQYTDFGGGISYHFFNPPNAVNKFIGFGNASLGVGKVSISTSNSTTGTSSDITGSDNFFSVGLGSKFYVSNGLGLRAMVDYYHNTESLEYPDTAAGGARSVSTNLNGFRFQIGMSYRF